MASKDDTGPRPGQAAAADDDDTNPPPSTVERDVDDVWRQQYERSVVLGEARGQVGALAEMFEQDWSDLSDDELLAHSAAGFIGRLRTSSDTDIRRARGVLATARFRHKGGPL